MKTEPIRSRVYTDRPDYADFDPPAKFEAIKSIIAKHLRAHPHAICSYSGGADSDIMIDLIEQTRNIFSLPAVDYVFFNTGLEMKATKEHVKKTAERYSVIIHEARPKINIVMATRKYGVPFVSKIMSSGLSEWQKKGVPLTIANEYDSADDKHEKRRELTEEIKKIRYGTYVQIGLAKIDKQHYSTARPDEYVIYLNREMSDGTQKWTGIIRDTDRSRAIAKIPEYIRDLQALLEKLEERGEG